MKLTDKPEPIPMPTADWRDQLTTRQRQEVLFASLYAQQFNHGTAGHNRLLLIAKLTDLLDGVASR